MNLAPKEISKSRQIKVRHAGLDRPFTSLSTDSRFIKKGALFVALKGPNFDGHHYIQEALQQGAYGIVVEKNRRTKAIRGRWIFSTKDSIKALGIIASTWRQQFSIPVIGITGSNGKTTCKELISLVLSKRYRVLRTAGNFNNLIGLPLTLMRINRRHEVAVLEMGMSAKGEIKRLAQIAKPHCGVITNIGRAHLEGLHSIQAIAEAKGELIEQVPEDGISFLNADDPRSLRLSKKSRAAIVSYGFNAKAKVRGIKFRDKGLEGTCFTVRIGKQMQAITLPLPGKYNAINALVAIAVGHHFQIPLKSIAAALRTAQNIEARMSHEKLANGIILIKDYYNANPDSTISALGTIKSLPRKHRKLFVLGDMMELGKYSHRAHQEIGREAATAGVKKIFVLGHYASDVFKGAKQKGLSSSAFYPCKNPEEAAQQIHDQLRKNDVVLIKGSRSMRMERVVHHLKQRRAA
jgi:UDP-N-acetylmuramoyl-tripeptide--D-alanyl-D-alanine ligase